jgi:hypothetical protein
VSKVVTAQVLLAYLLQHYLHLISPHNDVNEPTASLAEILRRLIVQKLTFATSGQLVVGTTLLALELRRFERELGSLRFLWLLLVVSTMVVLTEFVTINVVDHYGYVGPYQLIGACLWMYYRYTPRLYPNFVSVLGLSASEKMFYYLWFAQVIYQEGLRPAIMGALACALFLKLNLQFPAALSKQVSSLLLNIQAPPRVLLSVGSHHRAAGPGTIAHAAAAAAMAPRPPPRPVQADPAAVEQLVIMGFDQDQVVRALQATNNNVQRAADQLLSQVS